MTILFSTASYSFPQLQQMQQRAEKAEATAQEFQTKAQDAEGKLRECQTSAHRLNELMHHYKTLTEQGEAKLGECQATATRLNELVHHHKTLHEIAEQKTQEVQTSAQEHHDAARRANEEIARLQNELQQVRAQVGQGGQGGGNEEALRQEIENLRQQILAINPEAAVQNLNVPRFDPDNFIHNVVVAPLGNDVIQARDQAIQLINTSSQNLRRRIQNGYVPGPNQLPAIRMANMIQRRSINSVLENLENAISDPNRIEERSFVNYKSQIINRDGQLAALPNPGDQDYDNLLQGLQQLGALLPRLEAHGEQERLQREQQNIRNELARTGPLDQMANRILNEGVAKLKELIDPAHTPQMQNDPGGVGSRNNLRKEIRELVESLLTFIRLGQYEGAYKMLADNNKDKLQKASLNLDRIGIRAEILERNPNAEAEFIAAVQQFYNANPNVRNPNDMQVLGELRNFAQQAINDAGNTGGNPLNLAPADKRHFQEAMEKMLQNSFNAGVLPPVLRTLKDKYIPLRDNVIHESPIDKIFNVYFVPYHDTFKNFPPSVQNLHLMRQGKERFNAAWQIFQTPQGDPQPRQAPNQQKLSQIKQVQDPLNLEGPQRSAFARKLEELSLLKDSDFSGPREAIENFRNLAGSYQQISRAAADLYERNNPPPRA